MSRLVFLTFFGERRWPQGRHPRESPAVMTVPLVLLGCRPCWAACWARARAPAGLQRFLAPMFATGGPTGVRQGASALLLGATVLAAAAAGAGGQALRGSTVRAAHRQGGGAVASFLAGAVDRCVIDGAVNGLARTVGVGAERGRRVQSGLVRSYALWVLGGAVAIVALLILRAT